MAVGFAVWCGVAKGYYGSVNVASLGDTYAELGAAGSAAIVSGIICFAGMFVAPENYDFDLMRRKDAFQIIGVDAYGQHVAKIGEELTVSPVAVEGKNEYADEEKEGMSSSDLEIPAEDDVYVRNDVPDSVVSESHQLS